MVGVSEVGTGCYCRAVCEALGPQPTVLLGEVLNTQCGFSSWEAAWEHVAFWR